MLVNRTVHEISLRVHVVQWLRQLRRRRCRWCWSGTTKEGLSSTINTLPLTQCNYGATQTLADCCCLRCCTHNALYSLDTAPIGSASLLLFRVLNSLTALYFPANDLFAFVHKITQITLSASVKFNGR